MLRVFDKPRPGGAPGDAGAGRAAFVAGLAALAVWLVAGCGGAGPSREAALNDAFARIQVHEARIDSERAGIAEAEATCAARQHAAENVCGQRDAICGLAREVIDADALARCEHASDACLAARGEVSARCEPHDATAGVVR